MHALMQHAHQSFAGRGKGDATLLHIIMWQAEIACLLSHAFERGTPIKCGDGSPDLPCENAQWTHCR